MLAMMVVVVVVRMSRSDDYDDDSRRVAGAYLVLPCAASLQSPPVDQFIQSQLCPVYS